MKAVAIFHTRKQIKKGLKGSQLVKWFNRNFYSITFAEVLDCI